MATSPGGAQWQGWLTPHADVCITCRRGYEYLYITSAAYDEADRNRKRKVDVVNEMERATSLTKSCL